MKVGMIFSVLIFTAFTPFTVNPDRPELFASEPAPQQRPVFRSGIDYVLVDVVVTDRDDKPLVDLTRDDFTIVENGRRQAIQDFQFISIPVVTRTVETGRPASPEPDVVTNAQPSPQSRLFALVIDDLHIIESEIVPLKRVMSDFLRSLSPDDQVAVTFVGRSDLGENFTTDMYRVLRAVDRVRDAMGFSIDALQRGPGPDGKRAGWALGHGRAAAATLRSVAASLAGSGHSRRAVVYVSSGSPLDPNAPLRARPPNPFSDDREFFEAQLVQRDLQDAYDAARRANVPIYTLDPRGPVQANDAIRGGIGAIGGLGGSVPLENMRKEIDRRIVIQQDYLAAVAINTGGRAFINQSDLGRAVREIVAENGSYYLLGYYPDPFVRDGKFHPIEVRVNRPGARVRARQGYVAASETASALTSKSTLDAAMSGGVNAPGLALRVSAAAVAPAAKGVATVVTIDLTYPVVPSVSGRVDDDLLVSVMALDSDAKVKWSTTRSSRFGGAAPSGESITFVINEVVDLPSQRLTLRVGVASKTLGKAGTVQIPIDVPDPGDSKLQLGGVVLGLAQPSRATMIGADRITGILPFQPTTTRAFSASDELRVFVPVFWGSKELTASVTVAIRGATVGPNQTVEVKADDAGSRRHRGAADIRLPLNALPPGANTLDVTVTLANGQKAGKTVALTITSSSK